MIDVDSIYKQVAAQARKEQSGYNGGADFNRQQRLVQNTLFEWYFQRYERDQRVPDSLRPFIKEPNLAISSGEVTLPSDYRHRIEVQVGYVVSGQTTQYYPCPHLQGNSEVETSISYVRRPSAVRKRFYHTLKTGTLKILPVTFAGIVKLKYLSQPADAVWNSSIDTTNIVENYTSSGSVHFEWEPMDETHLVDLFCYFIGIKTRQSELLEWVGQKNLLVNTKP